MEFDLTKEIKDLLYYNESVIIPGFGAFITRYESARVDPSSKTLNPPKRNVEFKKNLAHDDELLTKHVAKSFDISEEKATEIINKAIQELKEKLARGKTVTFEGIGSIIEDPRFGYIFEAGKDINLLPDSFGMEEVKLFDIEESEEEKIEPLPVKKPETLKTEPVSGKKEKKKKSKSWLVILVTAIIVVFLVVLYIFTNVYGVVFNSIDEFVNSDRNEEEVIDSALQNYLETYGVGAELSEKTRMSDALSPEDKRATNVLMDKSDTTYYIVAGSFLDMVNARKMQTSLEKEGYKPEIISNDNKFRVVLYSFKNKDQALNELERVRVRKNKENAWILKKTDKIPG